MNTSAYDGDIGTSAIWRDAPDESKGKVNIATGMQGVMNLAIMCMDGEAGTTDNDLLRRVRNKLVTAQDD